MAFLIDLIKEQKILEMEVVFDDFIKEHNISEQAIIHTMTFDKEVFAKEEEVREYLKDKYMSFQPEVLDNGDVFTVPIVSKFQVDINTEVEIEIRRGVVAQAADLLQVSSMEEIRFNDKGEINLSSKFGTIDLSEGLPHIIEIARVAEGEHPSYGKLKITEEHLLSFKNNFDSNAPGVDLAVNEDHQKNEAFGWFKDVFLSFEGDILYGQVAWNKKGIHALSEKEYRYFSPEFRFNYVHPHTGIEHGPTLLGGALTNYPFLKMEAITQLSNKSQGEEPVVTETTINLSEHNAVIVELNGKLGEANGKLDAANAQNIELNSKVKELKKTIELNAAKVSNQKLFDKGLLTAAALVALNEGKSTFEVLALNEGLKIKATGSDEAPTDTLVELSDGDKKLAKSLGLSDEEFVAGNKQ